MYFVSPLEFEISLEVEAPFCPTNFYTQSEIEGNSEKQKDGQDFEVRSSRVGREAILRD